MIDGPWFCREQGTSVCTQAARLLPAHGLTHKERFSWSDIVRRKWKYETDFHRKLIKEDLVRLSEWLNDTPDHRPACSFSTKLMDTEEAKFPVLKWHLLSTAPTHLVYIHKSRQTVIGEAWEKALRAMRSDTCGTHGSFHMFERLKRKWGATLFWAGTWCWEQNSGGAIRI